MRLFLKKGVMYMNFLEDYDNKSSPGIVPSTYSNTLPSNLRYNNLVTSKPKGKEPFKRTCIWNPYWDNKMTNQRLAGLQHQAQQPRLATEADVKTGTNTRKRTKRAAADD